MLYGLGLSIFVLAAARHRRAVAAAQQLAAQQLAAQQLAAQQLAAQQQVAEAVLIGSVWGGGLSLGNHT